MEIQQLAARGLTFGLHVVVGATRWADFRAAMRDVFGTRLELRLGDPIDSEIDRKVAALVPTGRPGRGLVPAKLHFLGALPRIDGDGDADTLGDGVDDLIDAGRRRLDRAGRARSCGCCRSGHARRRPRGRRAPPACRERRILLGINEKELAPVGARPRRRAAPADLRRRPVRQERRCCAPTSTRSCAPARRRRRRSCVVDYRRSLLGEVPDEYLLNYLTSATQAHAGAEGPRDVPREPASPAPT